MRKQKRFSFSWREKNGIERRGKKATETLASAALQMKSRKMSECEWNRWPALEKWKHRPTDRRKWWRAFFRVQKEKYFYTEEAEKNTTSSNRHQQQQQHIVTVVTVWLCDWMKETNHLLRAFFICFISIVVVAVLYFHFKFCWMPLLSWPTCLSCARIHSFANRRSFGHPLSGDIPAMNRFQEMHCHVLLLRLFHLRCHDGMPLRSLCLFILFQMLNDEYYSANRRHRVNSIIHGLVASLWFSIENKWQYLMHDVLRAKIHHLP